MAAVGCDEARTDFAAVESLPILPRREVILMTPQGQTPNQPLLRELTMLRPVGCYLWWLAEGVDERVLHLVTS